MLPLRHTLEGHTLHLSDDLVGCRACNTIGRPNPESGRRRPLRPITHASSSSKGGSSSRNPQKAYRISSVGQSVLDTLVDVEVGCAAES